MKKKEDMSITAIIALYAVVILFNLAWVGTLIWALIYVVTHLGQWLG